MFNPKSILSPKFFLFFFVSTPVFVSAQENEGKIQSDADHKLLMSSADANMIIQGFESAARELGIFFGTNPKPKKTYTVIVRDEENQTLEFENGLKIKLVDNEKIKELSARISDFRQTLFNQFFQIHVKNPQAIVRGDLYRDVVTLEEEFDEYGNQLFSEDGNPILSEVSERIYTRRQPTGLYTRYSGMLEMQKVQKDYVEELVNRKELLELILDTYDELKRLKTVLHLPLSAERLLDERFAEYRKTAWAFSIKENTRFSFDGFLSQLEIADSFLENARQIFFAVIAQKYVRVERKGVPHSTDKKFVPVRMQTGLDSISNRL